MRVINNKTKKDYRIIDKNIINATNKDDGDIMILYQAIEGEFAVLGQKYVRNEKEFWEKFTEKK